MSAAFPDWDDIQEDDSQLWVAGWSHQHGGADVRTLDDCLRSNFVAWLSGRDSGWMILGVFPNRDAASNFLMALEKFRRRADGNREESHAIESV